MFWKSIFLHLRPQPSEQLATSGAKLAASTIQHPCIQQVMCKIAKVGCLRLPPLLPESVDVFFSCKNKSSVVGTWLTSAVWCKQYPSPHKEKEHIFWHHLSKALETTPDHYVALSDPWSFFTHFHQRNYSTFNAWVTNHPEVAEEGWQNILTKAVTASPQAHLTNVVLRLLNS